MNFTNNSMWKVVSEVEGHSAGNATLNLNETFLEIFLYRLNRMCHVCTRVLMDRKQLRRRLFEFTFS